MWVPSGWSQQGVYPGVPSRVSQRESPQKGLSSGSHSSGPLQGVHSSSPTGGPRVSPEGRPFHGLRSSVFLSGSPLEEAPLVGPLQVFHSRGYPPGGPLGFPLKAVQSTGSRPIFPSKVSTPWGPLHEVPYTGSAQGFPLLAGQYRGYLLGGANRNVSTMRARSGGFSMYSPPRVPSF
jgi:hypothetical protein